MGRDTSSRDDRASIYSLRARLAAHTRWAHTDAEERARQSERARDAIYARFERDVDPEGVLAPAERARRAEHARKAHMLRLSLKSAEARRLRRRG